MLLRKQLCLAVALLSAAIIAPPADAVEILLKPRVTSQGTIVLLGDVASVLGDASEAKVVQTLKRLELFPAPSSGRTRLLRRPELRELLALHGIDATQHRIAGSSYSRITPPRKAPPAPEMVNYEAAVETPVEPPSEVPVELVVVTTRTLTRGAILQADDVTLQPLTEVGSSTRAPLADLSEVIGKELTQSLAAGRPVEDRHLRRQRLIRRGEEVTVIARAAGVQVKRVARALSDGALGDLISLQTLDRKDQFHARVSGHRAAEVFASGVLVAEEPALLTPTSRPPQFKR